MNIDSATNKFEIMVKMRQEGYSLQAIGDKFNISRQRVSQIINYPKHHSGRILRRPIERVIYRGVRRWMLDNHITYKKLAVMMGYQDTNNGLTACSRKLTGKAPLTMDDINRLISITGLKYEECFKHDD